MGEQEYKKQIYKKASEVRSKEDLYKLIDEITEFPHDYGTVVYGCMAAMKAAFNVVNRSDQGGITGFQAGFLGWECVHDFMMVKPPCKLVDFNDMLYPQFRDKFEKSISPDTWDHLRKEASNLLRENGGAHPDVIEHWKSIERGTVPFGYEVRQDG